MIEKRVAFVNVSCANVYREPTFHSEVDSQSILWERLEIIDQKNDFILVTTEDKYKGWINSHQIIIIDSVDNYEYVLIKQRHVDFYKEPNLKSDIIRDGFTGIQIPVLLKDNGWIKTQFPDSVEGWIETSKTGYLEFPDRDDLINYARTFTGIPYIWGGKTVRGFDCSGFIQFIHKMFGINLRRDAWMQFEDSHFVSKNPFSGKPGDLLFFAKGEEKISHVGFVIKPGIVLHCQGMVKIESIDQKNKLLKDFVEIRTFLS
ncbi:MAG: NlpC/P60 family protein [Calditrichaceae bacterium]